VYGDSPTSAFALNANTGRKIWLDNLSNTNQGTFDIHPEVASGRVYLATASGALPGGGVLLALNASNGDLLWSFDTVPASDAGVVRAGGAWETPLVNMDGSVTYGLGNPYQSADSAFAHPSELLYTDSAVNLDAATGKLRWYYQGVPDDFRDYDMNASPISTSVNGVPVIIDAGKMGYVYEMGAQSGKLMWKTPVGKHNGHDNDPLEALKEGDEPKVPYTTLPGALGGVLTNMALADDTLYLVVCDLPFTTTNLNDIIGKVPIHKLSIATGEVEALNASTGKVEWDTAVKGMPLGAATVSNDLVFTTLYQGVLLALNRNTGTVVYRRKLPTSTNAPIAIVGNTVLIPAGGPNNDTTGLHPQLLAYTAS